MPDSLETPDEILKRYAGGPAALEAAIAGLSEAQLNLTQSADTWSIRQLVHHIVDGDDLWKTCIKAALGKPQAPFSLFWYWETPQTQWAEDWRYASRPVEPSLALFKANRAHILDLLQRVPDSWEKSILVKWPHKEEGFSTVAELITGQAGHALGHISDIQRIRKMHSI